MVSTTSILTEPHININFDILCSNIVLAIQGEKKTSVQLSISKESLDEEDISNLKSFLEEYPKEFVDNVISFFVSLQTYHTVIVT
jgi:hypothetical protein